MIPQYSTVRVIGLTSVPEPDRLYVPSAKRPQIGEEGCVVDFTPDGRLIVENVDPDGRASWLAVFHPAEVEVVSSP